MRGPHSWPQQPRPLGGVANRHRSATQIRVVALFDRRIERVHVHVDDLAQRHAPALSHQEQKENSVRFDRQVQIVPAVDNASRNTAKQQRGRAPLLERGNQLGGLALI